MNFKGLAPHWLRPESGFQTVHQLGTVLDFIFIMSKKYLEMDKKIPTFYKYALHIKAYNYYM